MRDLADYIKSLRWILHILFILGLWKIVETIMWLFNHVDIQVK
jgi:hypothetical protein